MTERGPATSTRRTVLRWWWRVASVLILLAVVDYVVLPQVAGTEAALRLLHTIRPEWAVAGVLLEGGSLVCYSLLTRSMFPGGRLSFGWLLRSDLTGLGLSHVLPAGGATAGAFRYKLLRQGGAPAGDAAVALAVEGAMSTLMLAVLLWLALVVSIPVLGINRIYTTAALIGAILLAGLLLALILHSREPVATAQPFTTLIRKLPQRVRPRAQRIAAGAVRQVNQLLSDRSALAASASYAAGNWVLDAASLWVFLAAFGHYLNPVALLVAYGIATLLGSLPITPGGLGTIEGLLLPALIGFGVPGTAAVLAVVSWRLFEFWLPVPVAGLAYLSLRLQLRWRHRRAPTRGPEAAGSAPAPLSGGPDQEHGRGEPVSGRPIAGAGESPSPV